MAVGFPNASLFRSSGSSGCAARLGLSGCTFTVTIDPHCSNMLPVSPTIVESTMVTDLERYTSLRYLELANNLLPNASDSAELSGKSNFAIALLSKAEL